MRNPSRYACDLLYVGDFHYGFVELERPRHGAGELPMSVLCSHWSRLAYMLDTHTHTRAHTHTQTHARTYAHLHTHTHTHTHVFPCTHACKHTELTFSSCSILVCEPLPLNGMLIVPYMGGCVCLSMGLWMCMCLCMCICLCMCMCPRPCMLQPQLSFLVFGKVGR